MNNRKLQFKLTDLLWFTTYFAVGAWLFSFGGSYAVAIWFATVFGFEVGCRTDYPVALMTMCGSVLGLSIIVAVFCTQSLSHTKLFVFGRLEVFQLLLTIATWILASGILIWLATRLRTASPKRRRVLKQVFQDSV